MGSFWSQAGISVPRGFLIRIKFLPGGPILTPKGVPSELKPTMKRHTDPFTKTCWFFHAAMFLFPLNGLSGLLLAWAMVCGVLWPLPDSFANPRDIFPPFVNSRFVEDEEIHDALIVSRPVQSFGNKTGSQPLVENMHQDPVFADLYFDEARSFIRGGIEVFLYETVALLKQENRWGLRIEGHCDSRGTSAYNLARADYHLTHLTTFLQMMGIQSERIQLVNFGQDPLACQGVGERCQEDNLRAERIFSILAVGQSQRGCLARLRLVAGEDVDRALRYSRRSPYLQRIQVASPHSSSF
jgi:outer membrane protein OmpA-like peptidoglycan-associated protein